MIKLLFMVHRKADLSRQECLAQWTGEKHLALLEPMKKLGFKKYVAKPRHFSGTGGYPRWHWRVVVRRCRGYGERDELARNGSGVRGHQAICRS